MNVPADDTQTKLARRLVRAVHRGSVEGVMGALNAGASVDSLTGCRSETALGRALARGHEAVALCLLEQGASVGWPPQGHPQPHAPAWRSVFSTSSPSLLPWLIGRLPGLLTMRTAEAAFLDGKVWDHPWAAAATAQAWDALVWMADQHDDRLHGKPPPFLRSFLVSPCSKAPTSVLSHLQPIVRWHSDHHTQFGELAAQAQPARSDAFGWAWKRTSDRGRMVIAAMEQGQHHLLTPEILDAPAILSILPRLALKAVELGHGGVFRAVFGAWIRDGRTWPQLAQLAETTWGTPLLHHGLSVIFLSKLGGKAVWLDSLLEAGAHLQLQVIDHNGNTALHALLAPIASDLNDLRTSRYLTQRLIARCVPLGVINHAGKDVLDLLPACFSDLSSIILARRMDTQMHRPEAVQARIRL